MADGSTIRMLRRIVEKRVCQDFWNNPETIGEGNWSFPKGFRKRQVNTREKTIDMIQNKMLGKDGLTVTSANHLANIAKEMYEAIENRLGAIKLYNRNYMLAVNGNSYGVENESEKADLEHMAEGLKEIGELKSLIAYLREAIKAKTELAKGFEKHIQELVTEGREDLRDPERLKDYTFAEEFAKLTPEQMARYYSLEARCAAMGAYIHPEGAFAEARKAFFEHTKTPTRISGKGQEAEINTFTSSFTAEEVDGAFFAIQKEYRGIQAEFNKLKSEIEERVSEANKKSSSEFLNAQKLAISARKAEEMRYDEEVKALKIVIPQNLKGVYDRVNGVASAK